MGFIETSYGSSPNLSQVNIDSDLNLKNEYDLIGVERFVCEDFLGAVRAGASNNTQWILILDDVTTLGAYSKKLRVPSNFVDSTINIKFYATNSTASNHSIGFHKYDPETQTYTPVTNISISANTTSPTEFNNSAPITVKAGELYCFFTSTAGGTYFYGSMGVKIMCDLSAVTGGYWEVEE